MRSRLGHVVRCIRAGSSAVLLLLSSLASAQPPVSEPPPRAVLFQGVRVFDGKSKGLSGPVNVLVQGNKIARISSSPIARTGEVRVIEGKGRTLMPGLIDAHYHMMMASVPLTVALAGPEGYLTLVAAREAKATLLRGFTSVRDMAGPVFSIKRGIDDGLIEGPRIWPSGAMISQTSGHGDYRRAEALPRTAMSSLTFAERVGGAAIADGQDEVLLRVREQLMLGASQIKLAAGGGVSSDHDPLDVSQYTEAELRSAVEAAENWGTYVAVHAYTPRAIQTAIRAGVKVIDHGQLMDDATAKLMAEKGVWLSLQPFLDDEDATPFPEGSDNREKQLEMTQGTDKAYALAKKYKLKTAWGTDSLFDPKVAARQGAQLVKMTRWYTPAEALRMATGTNAELLALSGKRSPYKGRLGVVEEGALADLLLVDGDPVANFELIANPEKNFLVIMKDGKIYKDLLGP
ncbi:amidohydrolase family protein [Myxococcus sp. MISCRS1]|uniref:metal-dependent hydrolase family protein n=1 Tax=Myxococcus TaxID=32 RepID=UPI00226DC64F|nr:amidohydrolase family protein [Myxococcus sp. MISCRS1]MCY1003868.1 amidohydrolase family protein [Myxococcus sp. MISCRS1]